MEKMPKSSWSFSQSSASASRSSFVKLLQQEQRLILDEFSHVQRCFLLFVIRGPRASVLNVGCLFSASSSSLEGMLLPVRRRRVRSMRIKPTRNLKVRSRLKKKGPWRSLGRPYNYITLNSSKLDRQKIQSSLALCSPGLGILSMASLY